MFSIIGIDPGSNTLGAAIITATDSGTITAIESFLFNIHHIQEDRKNNKLIRKLHYIRSMIIDLLEEYAPVVAVSLESPFIYNSRPAAVIPLSSIKGVIEETCITFNPEILLRTITPSEVKTSIGVHGNSGNKEDILNALVAIPEISSKIDLTLLTDHEWDAITIAYDTLNLYRTNPYKFL